MNLRGVNGYGHGDGWWRPQRVGRARRRFDLKARDGRPWVRAGGGRSSWTLTKLECARLEVCCGVVEGRKSKYHRGCLANTDVVAFCRAGRCVVS